MKIGTRATIRGGLAALLFAMLLAAVGCGDDDGQSSCNGCRINGSFYDPCPSYPPAYCGSSCTIVFNVCK